MLSPIQANPFPVPSGPGASRHLLTYFRMDFAIRGSCEYFVYLFYDIINTKRACNQIREDETVCNPKKYSGK